MGSVISIGEIQRWLDTQKLNLPAEIDEDLVQGLLEQVRAALAKRYDVNRMLTWTNPDNTPELIRNTISLLYAARMRKKLYAEEVDNLDRYAEEIENMGFDLLGGLLDGTLVLIDSDIDDTYEDPSPSFYPSDKQEAPVRAPGTNVGGPGWYSDEDYPDARRFTMGKVF